MDTTSERQQSYDELLERAQKEPGVKEAAEVYGRVAETVRQQVSVTTTTTSYATGGNQQ